MTVCITAIYMINNTQSVKKWSFRILVLGIFLSLLYDLVWLLIFNDINNDVDDGGLEKPVRIFSLLVAYMQLFFKVRILSHLNLGYCGPRFLERLLRL